MNLHDLKNRIARLEVAAVFADTPAEPLTEDQKIHRTALADALAEVIAEEIPRATGDDLAAYQDLQMRIQAFRAKELL